MGQGPGSGQGLGQAITSGRRDSKDLLGDCTSSRASLSTAAILAQQLDNAGHK